MNTSDDQAPRIDTQLVRALIDSQFPQWKDLPVHAVAQGGWDNRMFHLGETMLARLPSAAKYAPQVDKEQQWLPKLAPLLPLPIPKPLAIGKPTKEYPWKWSVYSWLQGRPATGAQIDSLCHFATDLALFLKALHRIEAANGPKPGRHNFHRGGSLAHYDTETRQALTTLSGQLDTDLALKIWEKGLLSTWETTPLWVHGDLSSGNLLVDKGKLNAVIDFGMLAIGDPACDLSIAWTLFEEKSRRAFRSQLPLDSETWARGRAWTLWKALIVAANQNNTNSLESSHCWRTIEEIFKDEAL